MVVSKAVDSVPDVVEVVVPPSVDSYNNNSGINIPDNSDITNLFKH